MQTKPHNSYEQLAGELPHPPSSPGFTITLLQAVHDSRRGELFLTGGFAFCAQQITHKNCSYDMQSGHSEPGQNTAPIVGFQVQPRVLRRVSQVGPQMEMRMLPRTRAAVDTIARGPASEGIIHQFQALLQSNARNPGL